MIDPTASRVRIEVICETNGFTYGDENQPVEDYYKGDVLDVSAAAAQIFTRDGWAKVADEGAVVGRAKAPGKSDQKQSKNGGASDSKETK